MTNNHAEPLIKGTFFAAIFLTLAACQTPAPKPMAPIKSVETVSATVESINVKERLLSLKTESGDVVTVQVDPLVRNFAQMKVGDQVVAQYREAIGAQIKTTGSDGPATVQLNADIARPGERPGASASSTTTIPVTIASVDARRNMVSFYRDDGLMRVITVQTPEAKAFIKQLKPGNKVEITYTEALAVRRTAQ
ncbi:MAG: hypothetical protein R3F24_05570 [Gammaproteobacteria bacterium]